MRLMTAQEAVATFGLPSTRTLRTMRQRGLPAIRLGKAYLFDAADLERHIEDAKVQTCPVETPDRASSGSTSARRSTSSGTKADANIASRLARQTADRLKALSKTSSASGAGQSGQTDR